MASADIPLPAENRLRRRAQLHIDSKQWVAAQAALESLLRRQPGDTAARLSLSTVLLQRGQLRAAAVPVLEISRQLPRDALMIAHVAQRLFTLGQTMAARTCFDHPEVARTTSRAALATLAHVRHMLGEPCAALVLVDRAIAAGVDQPEEHHFRAMLLQFVGRIDESAQALEMCLQRWPAFGSAALTRSRLHRQTPDTHHLEYLREQLRHVRPRSVDHAAFEFALFKEFDDLGRFEEAWPALQQANSIMRARNPYDPTDDMRLADATIACVNAAVCAGAHVDAAPDGPTPIFIVGMPRSGSTLLDRMLGNHSMVACAGEISDFFRQWCWMANIVGQRTEDHLEGLRRCGDIDFRELGQRYLKQTQWRAQGHAFYIDKMPNNFHFVGMIRRALPQARILHIVRDPMAVCFSNLKAMFGDASPHCYDMRALGQFYRRHEHLRQHWHATVPGAMLDVSYASLVREPEATMRRVLEFCNLGLEEDCLHPARNAAPVSTPSSVQVREPIHTRSLAEWQHYAAQLQPLRQVIEVNC